uniref:Uncharacterized protein n=1 Tax=Rhizophora mucronata TaxID=61149 RepID=A0A2P2KY82_RHIMU
MNWLELPVNHRQGCLFRPVTGQMLII